MRASSRARISNTVWNGDSHGSTGVAGQVVFVGANGASGSARISKAVGDSTSIWNASAAADNEAGIAETARGGRGVQVASINNSADIDASVEGEVHIGRASDTNAIDVVFAERDEAGKELAASVGREI